jgi:hypothetical protein
MTDASLPARSRAPAPAVWVVAAASFLPDRTRPRAARLLPHLPLLVILAVQAACSLRLRNSAFQDEALYIHTGHLLMDWWQGGDPVDSNPDAFFSGAPQLYPVWAALLDSVGGLTLVRLFSTVCMLGATVAVVVTTDALFPPRPGARGTIRPGLLAGAVFALSASVVFLGNFATFDAPSFALVAGAAAVAAWSGAGGRSVAWGVLVGALCALAVLLKYSSAIDVPFVVALGSVAGWTARARGATLRGLLAGMTCGGLLVASALTWAAPLLVGLRGTTTAREAIARQPAGELLRLVVTWDGLPLALLLVGAVVVARRRPALAALLALGAIAAPGYQIHLGEFVSLHKHVVLGLILGAPLIGAALTALGRLAWGPVLTALAIWGAFLSGMPQAQALYSTWPDTTVLQRQLTYSIRAMPWIRMVGDVPEPVEYGLQDSTRQWQWTATYAGSFVYHGRTGVDAYRQALRDNFFQLAFFDGSSPVSRELMSQMQALGFQETSVVRTPYTGHTWHIYQRFDHIDDGTAA